MTAIDTEPLTLHIEVTLRPATRDDLPRLEWFGLYAHYRRLYARTFEDQRQGLRLMLLADVNGFPVGQVFVLFPAGKRQPRPYDRGYLYALRVLEPFQRQGLGTRLIERAEAILRAKGYLWSTIAAAKTNTLARQLYERLGYEVYTESPGQWDYVDHEGQRRHVDEPSWMLRKQL